MESSAHCPVVHSLANQKERAEPQRGGKLGEYGLKGMASTPCVGVEGSPIFIMTMAMFLTIETKIRFLFVEAIILL
jgi:hypothetical protein